MNTAKCQGEPGETQPDPPNDRYSVFKDRSGFSQTKPKAGKEPLVL